MVFEVITIPKATSFYENGETYYNHNPQVIEGKDMFVKFIDGLHCGDDRILKSPVNPNREYFFFNTGQLPTDIFLRKGEKLYITSFSSSDVKTKVIHYNKEKDFNTVETPQEFQVNLTGLVSPK